MGIYRNTGTPCLRRGPAPETLLVASIKIEHIEGTTDTLIHAYTYSIKIYDCDS